MARRPLAATDGDAAAIPIPLSFFLVFSLFPCLLFDVCELGRSY
jgi:hypothetical protein